MTDTTISDAICVPQDDGTGVADGSEDYNSAAYIQLLSKYKGDGSYVGEDNTGSATLQFNDVDTTNEQVDVGTGYAYIMDGNHTVQSGFQTTYDTTLPVDTPYVVILPTTVVGLGLGTDTDNDVWLAVDPTTNDSVYIRHGSGLSAPTDPSVKLGTVNTSTGATTRPNDLGSTSLRSLSTDSASVTNQVDAGSLSADSANIASYHTASDDAELDDVLSSASDGDTILLGNSDFSTDRNVSTSVMFIGSGRTGSVIDSNWTVDSRCEFIGISVGEGYTITVNERIEVNKCVNFASTTLWDVYADRCKFNLIEEGEISFGSSTQDGIVDSSSLVSVTGNTTDNTVGDIA